MNTLSHLRRGAILLALVATAGLTAAKGVPGRLTVLKKIIGLRGESRRPGWTTGRGPSVTH